MLVTSDLQSTQQVWERLSDRLRRFLRARVRDEATAEDLLQETFLRIHRGLGTLSDQERLGPWVFRIARNLVTDHYRARGQGGTEIGDASVEATDDENLNDEVSGWLPAYVQGLPEPYREAVQLHELEGLKQTEIAERLGISLSAAKSRVQRGRQKVKQMLEDCCAFDIDRRGNVLGYEPRQDCERCDD